MSREAGQKTRLIGLQKAFKHHTGIGIDEWISLGSICFLERIVVHLIAESDQEFSFIDPGCIDRAILDRSW